MKIKKEIILLFFLFILALFLRFYKLGEIPNGLYQDETAIGYNAFSILETGKDEYGKTFPLYFKSFGDQKLPVYIYSAAVSVDIFGLNAYAVRFPSAFFGFLSIIIFYFFIRNLTNNKKIAIVASALLVINPWSLHYNRATFEVSIGLFLFILGGYLLNVFFRKHIKGAFFIGTICFILCLYSYNLTRLLSPALFLLFIAYNRQYFRKANKKELLVTSVLVVIALIPFFQTLFDKAGAASASGTLIFSSAVVQAPFHELRYYANMLPNPIAPLFFNKYILTLWQYLSNIFSYFSVPFFFISGSSHGNHGIGNVGLFYLFELPMMVLGVISIIKKRMQGRFLLFGWAAIVVLVAALTRDVPHATRSFFLIVPLQVFSAVGVMTLFFWLKNITSVRLKIAAITIAGVIVAFNIVYYFVSYYVRFPVVYAKSWNLDDRDVSLFLKDEESKYERIIFDKKAGFVYTSLLFYRKYSPSDFQNTVKRLPDDDEGFSKVASFGKYEFRDIDWENDIKRPKTLIVTRNEYKPENVNAFKVFFFPKRYAAFAVGQKIVEYPLEDLSYVMVETK